MPERVPTTEEMEAICEKLMKDPHIMMEFSEIAHRNGAVFFLLPHGCGWTARNVAVGNGILTLSWSNGRKETCLSFIREDLLPIRPS